jgi:excisionase family DNA binding protein
METMATSLLSPAELAAYLNVPIKSVYRWRTTGDGPRGIRVGKHVRYRQTDVDAWLTRREDQSVTTQPPAA